MASQTSATRRKPGRPSKLSPETAARVLSAVRCGAPNKVACAAAGICTETMNSWLRKADDRPGSEYAAFSANLTRARQEGITARLAIIQKAAVKDWRAAAWLLERDVPDQFSLRFRVEHSAEPATIAAYFLQAAQRAEEIERTDTARHAIQPPISGNGRCLQGGSG